jgi:hypothetical protein
VIARVTPASYGGGVFVLSGRSRRLGANQPARLSAPMQNSPPSAD